MVDHTFLFSGAVRKIRQLVDDGTLGDLYYFDSTRRESGPLPTRRKRRVGSRAHDLSIMDYHHPGEAGSRGCNGGKHLNGLADVAFITVYFPHDVIAHINVNWLSPVKVRKTLIGGEKKMLVWKTSKLMKNQSLR